MLGRMTKTTTARRILRAANSPIGNNQRLQNLGGAEHMNASSANSSGGQSEKSTAI